MTVSSVELREFLAEHFSLEGLSDFCLDHFREVYEDNEGTAVRRTQYVQHLVEYCELRGQIERLQFALRKARPKPFFEKFGLIIDDAELREFLTEYFSFTDLSELCFYNFPHFDDNYRGTGISKAAYIRNIIEYCRRLRLTESLYSALRKERPNVFSKKFEFVEDESAHVPTVYPVQNFVERPLKYSTSELEPHRFKEQFVESFSLDDLRSICFDLNVRFDNIPGENTITRKVEELYLLLDRAGKLELLIQRCRELRSDRIW